MNMPLQDFSPGKSNYERPTLGWTCGKNADGEPCSIGPSSGGDCQVYLECVPARDAGGYICSRAPAFGGKCEKGPLPDGNCRQPLVTCHPRRTLFARRQIVTTTLAGLALGVLLCTFGGKAAVRNAVTSPGALTLQHVSIDHKCKHCHARSEDGFDKLTDSLTSADSVALTDSNLCLKCHDFGPYYLNPHSLSADELAALTEQATSRGSAGAPPLLVSLATQLAGSPMDEGELACSRCHKEHRGKLFDLTRMADAQCQICHTGSFHSFKADHPEFSDFPYTLRTHIHFDHATHFGIHFTNFTRIMPHGRAPESCDSCHQPDPAHQTMPLVDYVQACGSCHDDQLEDPLNAIEFLTLPQIDLEALTYEMIGDWPKNAASSRSRDSRTGFMQLLLENDADWSEAEQIIEAAEQDGDFAKAQEHIVWAIKRLLNDLVQNGNDALRERLAARLGDAGRERIFMSALTDNGVFLKVVATASAKWFPNLEYELAQHEADKPLQPKDAPDDESTEETADADANSGGSGDDDETSDGNDDESDDGELAGWTSRANAIAYVPAEHADPVLRALIETLVSIPDVTTIADPSKPPAARRLFAMVTNPGTPFGCMKCHTVDVVDETPVVNWHGRRRSSQKREFVRFSHAPHVTLKKCVFCHQTDDLDPANDLEGFDDLDDRREGLVRSEFIKLPDWDSAYVDLPDWTVNTDPHSTVTSGFVPVERSLCVQCHDRQRAGESCVKCHNYHVGYFPLGISFTAQDEPTERKTDDGTAMPRAATDP